MVLKQINKINGYYKKKLNKINSLQINNQQRRKNMESGEGYFILRLIGFAYPNQRMLAHKSIFYVGQNSPN